MLRRVLSDILSPCQVLTLKLFSNLQQLPQFRNREIPAIAMTIPEPTPVTARTAIVLGTEIADDETAVAIADVNEMPMETRK